ncbi:MAG: helix-turn-helix transcriptional regulator [Cyclobacteriaceae bacterium]
MFNKELIGASTVPLILTVLLSGENYGYELIKKVKMLSNGKLEWSEAMLYPVLHRLERDGFIHSKWHQLENGRKRKYYSLSDLGRSELAAKKSDWIEMMQLFSELWNLKPAV